MSKSRNTTKRARRKGYSVSALKSGGAFRLSFDSGLLLRTLLFLVAMVVVVQSGRILLDVVNLPVSKVVISGNYPNIRNEELESLLLPWLTEGYLTVDLHGVKAALEKLEIIESAIVKRGWPDVIEIQIAEQIPVARWQDKDYLNESGELFRPEYKVSYEWLPQLYGPQGSHFEVLQRFEYVDAQMTKLGLTISEFRLDQKGAQMVRFNNGMDLMLGTNDVSSKLQRFVRIYESQLAERIAEVKRVDLRYPNGIAVEWSSAVEKIAHN